jgi:hypothetical protein
VRINELLGKVKRYNDAAGDLGLGRSVKLVARDLLDGDLDGLEFSDYKRFREYLESVYNLGVVNAIMNYAGYEINKVSEVVWDSGFGDKYAFLIGFFVVEEVVR